MNTPVNPEVAQAAEAVAAQAIPVVAQVAPAVVAPEVIATAPVVASALANDFVDEDDEPEAPVVVTEVIETVDNADSSGNGEGLELLEAGGDGSDTLEGNDGPDVSVLDALEGEADDDQTAVIDVCKKKCVECSHLVPWAEKAYTKCHFSNGNENCPAKSIRIELRIPYEEIVPRFLAAEEQNDVDRLMRLMTKLKAKPDWMQDRILNRIKLERSKRTLAAA